MATTITATTSLSAFIGSFVPSWRHSSPFSTFLFGVATGLLFTTAFVHIPQPAFLTKLFGRLCSRITEKNDDTGNGNSITNTGATATLAKLEQEFSVNTQKLSQIVKHMISEMKKGLLRDGQTLKMIPSFVTRQPTGNETGKFLALDLGGSNFRVCEVILEGQGHVRMRQKKYPIGDDLKKASGDVFFAFLADCVSKFVHETEDYNHADELKLGFTFSFPVTQVAINRGSLMHWNKGFECAGVEGEDVVLLLQKQFNKLKLNIHVSALVNDTVGTLCAHAYQEPQTYVGVILGTGTNAAYVEDIQQIPKWRGGAVPSGKMIINSEWGAFDNEKLVLPVTSYDNHLDRMSGHPGTQVFEKMISGLYLGEVTRLVIKDLIATGELFGGKCNAELDQPYNFETAYMSRIERDHSAELSDIKLLLQDIFHIEQTNFVDRQIVKRVCELVGIRAARLSAAGIAAVVTKINKLDYCTIAIDGSLFSQYPHFANRMKDALRELLGLSANNINLELAKDGSGQGAALIAALSEAK